MPRPDTPYHTLTGAHLVTEKGAEVVATEHGAHVVLWRTADGRDRLFLSARSSFHEGEAIRGGVPVIFPQFAATGPYPRHGFARTASWTLDDEGFDGDVPFARFTLLASDRTRAAWPFDFAAALTVRLEERALEIALAVTNPSPAPIAFTAALHTYLQLDDVAQAALHGLTGVRMRDGVAKVEATDDAPALHIGGEVDRIYFDVAGPVTLLEAGVPCIRCSARGFPDVVVWNPGAERAAALSDLGADEARRFVCVEAAAVGRMIEVAPGATWTGVQRLDAL